MGFLKRFSDVPIRRAVRAALPVIEELEDRYLLTAPQILLTPGVLANLRQEAADNSPVWQAFKARLDDNLDVVIADNIGSYEGSQLAWIDDYALGYQVLVNSDPLTADNYADKAIGLMKSGLDDFQRGSWVARQFVARGDGSTRTFTLPDGTPDAGTLTVYLSGVDPAPPNTSPVDTPLPVVHQAANSQDNVGSENLIFLKVSNTPDGPADYAEGTDWTHNANFPNDEIDWSIAANQPGVGATYYVTYTSGENANATTDYTLNGDTITFTTAPPTSQAIFVQYIYGTHSANGSTLAYQQTSAGDGGFNNVFIDDGYSYRYLGSSEAMGLDWLDGYVGMTAAFEKQVETMLARWSDYVQANPQGTLFLPNSGASNYGAMDYKSEVLTALALAPRDPTDGPALLKAALAWRQNNLLPVLENPTASDAGGFWAEGWNYGTGAVQALLIAGDALQTAGLITATPEAQFSDQVLDSLVEEESSPGLTYDGGEDYQYPFQFLDKSLFYVLSQTCASPTEQSYANYVIQNYADSDFGESTPADYEQLLFENPSAPASFWSALPLGYLASGTGLMTARSDWGSDPTWVSTQIGNQLYSPNDDNELVGHQFNGPGQMEINSGADQLLINAYQVYHVYGDDALTPIQESGLGNLLVINDPTDERDPPNMGLWYGTPGVVDTAYENTAAYTYFAGNYAAAYSPEDDPDSGGQVSQLTREVVFVRPDIIFVYDRAATTSASDDKILRWYFQNAPTVNGNSFAETAGSSTLFGQMYSTVPITTSLASITEYAGDSIGAPFPLQQLDTEDTSPTASVNYLTAFQVAPSTTTTMDPSEHILSTNSVMEGTEIDNQVVLFGRSGPVTTGATIAYSFNGTAAVQHLLVDLMPSQTYDVIMNGSNDFISSSDQGTLTFSTPAGISSVTVTAQTGSVATQFKISGEPASVSAGQSFKLTVTAEDASGNPVAGYTGTVHFTSSAALAVLPANFTFTSSDHGTRLFTVTLKTAGSQTIMVTDTTTGITGTSAAVTVAPAATSRLLVAGFSSPVTAGAVAKFTVTAVDEYGNTTPGFSDTVHFAFSDGRATVPANYTFTRADAGAHQFTGTFVSAGTRMITATDTVTATIKGLQTGITVLPAAASQLLVILSTRSTTAGVALSATVTVQDPYLNTVTGYTGTVAFTSTDSQAVLPAKYTFTDGDAGVHTFTKGVTLFTVGSAGTQKVTATDTTTKSITGTSTVIKVSPAALNHLAITSSSTTAVAGNAFNVTVTAQDLYGNTATSYSGTVQFKSTDGQAALPASFTFASGSNGQHVFRVALKTAGEQTVTVTDTVNSGLTATSADIKVSPNVTRLLVVAGFPSPTTAGVAHNFTVMATDAYGNVTPGYTGGVHFTSSDAEASLPANYTFTSGDQGVHTFSAALDSAGAQLIKAADTVASSINGSQSKITVDPATASKFKVTSSTNSPNAGTAFKITVTALDAFGNVVAGYSGTVHFTSTDTAAVLPADYTFTSGDQGVHTFLVTLNTSGSQSITATDMANASITGSATGLKVSATDALFGTQSREALLGEESDLVTDARVLLTWPTRIWLDETAGNSLDVPPHAARLTAAIFEEPELLSTPAPQAGLNSLALAACVLGHGLLNTREPEPRPANRRRTRE